MRICTMSSCCNQQPAGQTDLRPVSKLVLTKSSRVGAVQRDNTMHSIGSP